MRFQAESRTPLEEAYLSGAILVGAPCLLEARVGGAQWALQQANVVTVVIHLLLLKSVRIAARAALPHGAGFYARCCFPNLGTIVAHCGPGPFRPKVDFKRCL